MGEVLAPAEPATKAAAGEAPLAAVDAAAARNRERALAEPESAAALFAAADSLFLAAELRSELDLEAALAGRPPADVDALLALEETPREPWRAAILALCAEGEELARRALELDPELPGAHHYRALHLASLARARGIAQSLLAGLGPKIDAATRAAVAADPAFDDGSPHVLRGRFLDVAPWPFGDREEALEHLERAAELGPTIPCALFLGDALWRAGRPAEAPAAWRLAFDVAPVEGALLLAPFQLARARLRLELAARER